MMTRFTCLIVCCAFSRPPLSAQVDTVALHGKSGQRILRSQKRKPSPLPGTGLWLSAPMQRSAGLPARIRACLTWPVIDLFERPEQEDGPADRRLRIEHAQHLRPEDIPRFAKLHVIASVQPYHAIDDGRWAETRIGHTRAATTYAFKSLLDAGATLAFGSDWFVAPMNPIEGIYAATTRRTLDGKHPDGWFPEQRVTVAQAVHAYTVGSVFAESQDEIKGSIAPGKLADFDLLSDDIFTWTRSRSST